MASKIQTCLLFSGNGKEAAECYVSLVPNSRIERIFSPTVGEPPLTIEFTLGGVPYQILNRGPKMEHTGASSIVVLTNDQAETDRLWDALAADGGEEKPCGWLRDRFGIWWQIVPEILPDLLMKEDQTAAGRVMEALLTMNKIDSATLEAAFRAA
ncbi:VOC family protein [Chelativorans sp. YIM 93263]|uniref:VOC family protein n=1 Tax=Chelativorans sp. YIM 93263 TaxID=2906648 RepID=UPI0023793B03|nr:VOC family protein [Chelativorans sp. YIM 93263]